MKKTYKCKTCGTRYSTNGDIPPPSPKWDDGHVCEMISLDSEPNLSNTPPGIE